MNLQTPYMAASNALFERMKLAFSPAGLALYEEKVEAPKVDQGMPKTIAPFHVWVDFLPGSNDARGSATTSEIMATFALDIYCVTKHTNRNKAVETLQAYMNSVCMSILADATLNRAVNNAIPRIADAAVDTTPEKQYVAAAVIEVSLMTASVCPREFKELVRNAANSN